MSKQILLNAFDMNAVGHIAHGLWRHPEDRSSDYTSLDYWIHLARTLERGLFDGIFLADVAGVYDVYKGGPETAIRQAVQIPVNDPSYLVPAMAAVTEHLGFGITANLTYEPPYLFARRFSTLDHLTRGRIAWNIVTGFLDSSARGTGLDTQLAHDERYDRADEFLEVVYKLWEGSWDDDAVVRDRARGVYAEPGRVRPIRHEGRYFKVDAIHLSEPSPQRTPVLFQAGASSRGQSFAVRHGECIFVPSYSKETARPLVQALRDRARAQGRPADSLRVFGALQVVIGRTRQEAEEKYAEWRRYATPEAGLAQLASAAGIDFSRYGLDEPIQAVRSEAIQSIAQSVTKQTAGGPSTVRRLLEGMPLGGRFTPLVGTPDEIVEEIRLWVEQVDIDGFNLVRTVSPGGLEDFVDLVIPRLQRAGLYKRAYAPGTLREKLFGPGQARLPESHHGAGFRHRPPPALKARG